MLRESLVIINILRLISNIKKYCTCLPYGHHLDVVTTNKLLLNIMHKL